MATRKTTRKTTTTLSAPEKSGVVSSTPPSDATASSHITVNRVYRNKQARFNPIKRLTPENLSNQMDAFATGILREFALTMDAVENRDDTTKNVAGKRKAAIARREWSIVGDPTAEKDDAEVQSHKDVLEYFYRNLTATNALDRNERRGFSLLVKQMMDAVGKGWAVHELIWSPSPDGLTATFNFVPLWFFENRFGDLRFLPDEGAYEGVPLEPGSWMVTCGPRLMEATVVAYLFKLVCKRLELIYCEKHGMPGIVGKTNAAHGSPKHAAMLEAVEAFSADFSAVTGLEDIIEKIDCASNGPLPYGTLIDRADKAIAALWRGSDLSTISSGSGEGTGASLQGKEALVIEMDDAALISETLHMQIDRQVIEYHFGPGTKPRAYIKVMVPEPLEVDKEIKVDQHLVANGVDISKADMRERYGRGEPVDSDDAVTKPEPEPVVGPGKTRNRQDEIALANERTQQDRNLVRKALTDIEKSGDKILQPVFDRLDAVFSFEGKAFDVALHNFRKSLPEIAKEIPKDSPVRVALEGAMTAGFFNAFAEAHVERHA